MRRTVNVFSLMIVVVGVTVGCGKKPDPEPEAKVTPEPAPPEKAKPTPTPNPEPRPKPKPRPGPKPEPSTKQPDVIFGAYNRFDAKTQLQKIFFALASYENTHMHYPAGIVGPDGNLGLSWRVATLPYLDDESAKLYKEFKLTEAWDSPHNKALLTKMPKQFATPGTAAAQGKTYLRSFAGPKAFIPRPEGMKWGAQPGQPARGRASSAITDGAANTLMLVEANEPVEWTKPDELVFAEDSPAGSLPKFGLFQKEFHGMMCDGSVHSFPETLTEKSLRALISTNAGDAPGPDTRILFTPPAK